jgi:hypothetical protein
MVVGEWLPTKLEFQETQVKLQPYYIGSNVCICHKYIVISLVNTSLTPSLFQSIVFDLQILRLSGYCFFSRSSWAGSQTSCLPGRCCTHLSHPTSLVWFQG